MKTKVDKFEIQICIGLRRKMFREFKSKNCYINIQELNYDIIQVILNRNSFWGKERYNRMERKCSKIKIK